MSWEPEIRELERRRHLALQQGGKEGIAKQHARGRMTIRERIDVLLDENSFREHGRATASPVYNDNGDLEEYVPAKRWFSKCCRSAQERLRRTFSGAIPHAFGKNAGRRRWQRKG